MELCKELDIEVEEKFFTIEELKNADAAFFCGTAAEIIGIESLDDCKFPLNWNDSVSRKIQLAYKDKVVEAPSQLSPKEKAISTLGLFVGDD